jgi:CheY-like chemotaxis protein
MPPKILLVEDDEMNRDMLSRRLEMEQYSVVLAANGAEGVDLARKESPDLIVMDVSLPELDGWQATRILKDDAATQGIPVVVLTAHAMTGDAKRSFEAGCDAYETKPVDWDRLTSVITNLLKRS